jgi:hypothetical protein
MDVLGTTTANWGDDYVEIMWGSVLLPETQNRVKTVLVVVHRKVNRDWTLGWKYAMRFE